MCSSCVLVAMLVRWVWLVVSLSFCDGKDPFSVVVPRAPVYGFVGSSVTLPCSISPPLNTQSFEVFWYRPKEEHTPILFYQDQKIRENPRHPQYQGRVSLLGGLGEGNVSVKLENIRLADKGEYICRVEKTEEGEEWYDEATMSLKVNVGGSVPVLSVSDVGGGQVNVSCQSHGWRPEPSLSWTDRDGRNLKHLSTDKFTKDSEGLVSVSSWLLISPSASDWLSCSVGLSDSSSERKESRVLPHTSTVLTGSEIKKTECREEESWKEAFIATLTLCILSLLGIVGVGVYYVLHRKGVCSLIGSKRKKTEGREGAPALHEEENQPLMESQTADKSLQSVFTVNHDQKPEPNVNSSPSAESQTVNEVEEQQLQTQTEDTPHQPTGGNHDQDPQRNQNSSPPAGGDQDQKAETNQISAFSTVFLGRDQDQNAGVKKKSSTFAGGDQGQNAGANKNLSPPAGGDHNQKAGANQKSSTSEGDQGKNAGANQKSSPPAGGNHEQDQVNVTSPQSAGTENQLVNPSELNLKWPFTAAELQQVKKCKAKITIHPEETPEIFRISRGTSVHCLRPNENHEEEKRKIFTLCRERFSSGQQYWELKVKDNKNKKLSWFVGVAAEEAERIHRIPLTPVNGFWVLCYEEEKGVYIRESPIIPTTLPDVSDDLRVIGVFLDCDNHTLSFYNTETQSHIYTYTSVTPRTSLRPLISPGIRDIIPVKIC